MRKLLIIGLMLFAIVLPLWGQNTVTERFLHPDSTCRPWVRLWWNGDKVERDELLRELRLLHDACIGGAGSELARSGIRTWIFPPAEFHCLRHP